MERSGHGFGLAQEPDWIRSREHKFECGYRFGASRSHVCRRPADHGGYHFSHRSLWEMALLWWRKKSHRCDVRMCCKVCGRHTTPHRGCILR